jgi:hypothetical protein
MELEKPIFMWILSPGFQNVFYCPCLHRNGRVTYALNSAAVILASSNGETPKDVKALERLVF